LKAFIYEITPDLFSHLFVLGGVDAVFLLLALHLEPPESTLTRTAQIGERHINHSRGRHRIQFSVVAQLVHEKEGERKRKTPSLTLFLFH
jgi:hypothetical protein